MTETKITTKKTSSDTKEDVVRFVPLGGFEEVGRNMAFFEYQDEIIIVDAGLQMPEESTPGIDYIIPNTNYLQKNKEKIKALIITHGHYDHIGALPYIINKIGNPTIYTAALPRAMVLKRHEEFRNLPRLNIEVIKPGDQISFGKNFQAEFFTLEHTIPDTIGTILKTPIGNICYFTDFSLDYNLKGEAPIVKEFQKIGKKNIHTLIIDSTNAPKEGRTVSERVVEKNLEKLIAEAEGRVIVATFASLLTRLGEIIKIATAQKRKVFLAGFSMKTNIQIAQNLGYLKIPSGVITPLEELKKYKDDKILILSTGAQGEANANLMRIANGEHKFIKTKPGDTFILSSSIIAGNERSVQIVKDNLTRQGGRVLQSTHIDIHSSGHAPEEELKDAINAINPKFMIPAHGYFFMRAANRDIGVKCGLKKENILLLDNGHPAELTKTTATISSEQIEAYPILVDGLGVGDVGEVVLRDRRVLAQEGMVVMIITIGKNGNRILKNPDIISRGFVYIKENKELFDDIRRRLRRIIEYSRNSQNVDAEYFKTIIRDQIGEFLFRKTQRRPMILPVIIEV